MKAAVLVELNAPLVLWEVASFPLRPAEVRVRIDATGLCHSDLNRITGAIPGPLPSILGHEACGTVLEVGPQVVMVKPGDRVVSTPRPVCGNCWYCVNGQSNLCERAEGLWSNYGAIGPQQEPLPVMSGLGTFRDEMNVDQAMLVKVDTDLPSEELALLGCGVTTGVGAALNTAKVEPGSTVAIFGCGGVGLACVQGCYIAGASRIFAIDPVEAKRTAAREMGASDAIDPDNGNPVDQVKEATQGRGVDYAFEMVGSAATILQARASARRGGTTILVGAPRMSETVTFSAWDLHVEGRILGCSYGSAQVRRDIPRYVRFAEMGRLNLGAMISRRIKLEGLNEAFRAMRTGEVIRSVVVSEEGRK